MYLALFLVPWMLVYAVATMAMNHRDFFRERYGGNLQQWEAKNELAYERTFSSDAEPDEIGAQILADLDMSGPFRAVERSDGNLRIDRSDPVVPRRITYTPESGQIVVEQMIFRAPVVLTRLHHRHGYRSEHIANDLWAVSVDVAVFAMVFWVLSGLWMWWEMKTTRRWGMTCLVLSFGLFGFFLCTI
jgi:hypothetical protein